MKHFTTILFLLTFGFSNAQITNGTYFNYGWTAKGEQVIFLPDNYIQFIIGKDTIGGLGTNMKGKIISSKYVINNTVTPNHLDIIFYDKDSGKELNTTKALYRQVDKFSIDIAMRLFESDRPAEINENNSDIMRLTLNSSENYTNILRLNEQNKIIGFVPETKVLDKLNGIKEITYLQNGNPIDSKIFQTKEVCEYNSNKKITKQTLYDINNKLFINGLGYCKKVIGYDPNGQIELVQYYKNENELMKFDGRIFPETKYTYKGNDLIQIDNLINNDSLKLTKPTTTKFLYDSFGDQIDWELYFADGTLKTDTLKTIVISNLNKWLKNFAKYPKSFEPIIYGKPNESWTSRNNVKVPKSEKHDIYAEFYLNDSSNVKKRFTGFFQLDFEFNVKSIAYKNEKTGTNQNLSWNSADYDNWFNTYGRELTKEEIEKRNQQDQQQINEVLDQLNKAIEGNDPDIKIGGDMDKKALKKIKKELKKARKSKKE